MNILLILRAKVNYMLTIVIFNQNEWCLTFKSNVLAIKHG